VLVVSLINYSMQINVTSKLKGVTKRAVNGPDPPEPINMLWHEDLLLTPYWPIIDLACYWLFLNGPTCFN